MRSPDAAFLVYKRNISVWPKRTSPMQAPGRAQKQPREVPRAAGMLGGVRRGGPTMMVQAGFHAKTRAEPHLAVDAVAAGRPCSPLQALSSPSALRKNLADRRCPQKPPPGMSMSGSQHNPHSNLSLYTKNAATPGKGNRVSIILRSTDAGRAPAPAPHRAHRHRRSSRYH